MKLYECPECSKAGKRDPKCFLCVGSGIIGEGLFNLMIDIKKDTEDLEAIQTLIATGFHTEEEMKEKMQFHTNRLFAFAIFLQSHLAKDAAAREDSKRWEAAMACGNEYGHYSFGSTAEEVCGGCGTIFDGTVYEQEEPDAEYVGNDPMGNPY